MNGMAVARTLVLGGLAVGGCSETSTTDMCPITTVVLDGGTADLPPVGEYGFDKTCEPFCGPKLPVCRRVKELVLTCQPGCG